MDGDVVTVFINGLQIHGPVHQAGQRERRVYGQEGIVAEDGHAQLGGDIGHLHADGAQADDAQHLAGEFRAHELALALLHHFLHVCSGAGLLPHPGGAAHHVAGGQQQSAHGQFLDGVGVGAGGVEDHDARLGAAVDGDIIGARPRPGDAAQGVGEGILVHVGGTDEDAVLILHISADGEAGLIQHGQPGRGNLIQRLDPEHRCPSSFNCFDRTRG